MGARRWIYTDRYVGQGIGVNKRLDKAHVGGSRERASTARQKARGREGETDRGTETGAESVCVCASSGSVLWTSLGRDSATPQFSPCTPR